MIKEEMKRVIDFITNYFKENSFAKGVVIGMSGGKDSLVAAKMCIEALGKDKVLGVIMPNGEMIDKNDAVISCEMLGIKYVTIDINKTYENIIMDTKDVLKELNGSISSVTTVNTAPRIRMTMLYAIAGSLDYLVVNTSNLSETMVGYTTKWGDNVGDIAPLANLTKSEVCEIGLLLGLPIELVNKKPSDGLSGKSDEENMGISYDNLDSYIRKGLMNDDVCKINKLYKNSNHKRTGAVKCENNLPNYLK